MKLSRWDRFTAALAPRWTERRLRSRAVIDQLAKLRTYEAASSSRRTTNWTRNFGDANSLLRSALAELRTHARDLTRNNSWGKRGPRVIANNTVGWGISAKATGTSTERAAELWKKWAGSTDCESEGRQTFTGVQHLALRTTVCDGEVLIRRRWRRASDGYALPFQIQVLEADFLDSGKDAPISQSGGKIVMGVEFDKLGRRAAYWLFPEHPGSSTVTAAESRRVPAEDVIHMFYTDRPGQVRGVSWLATAIVSLKDLEEYEDAELVKQKIAACFAAFVTDLDGLGEAIGEQDTSDDNVETLEPGMIKQLKPGQNVTLANPPGVTTDSLPVRTLRKIAAGLGITYEDLTGDYSNVNFSSARQAKIGHWANVYDWQENMVIPQLCASVWRWAMEAAVVSGEISGADVPGAEWTTMPMPMIEPDKEGLAISRLVRNGAKTFSAMVREQGGDPDTHFEEYAADLKRLKALDIKLDSNVADVSQAGLTQERAGGAGGEKPGAEGEADAAPPPEKKGKRHLLAAVQNIIGGE